MYRTNHVAFWSDSPLTEENRNRLIKNTWLYYEVVPPFPSWQIHDLNLLDKNATISGYDWQLMKSFLVIIMKYINTEVINTCYDQKWLPFTLLVQLSQKLNKLILKYVIWSTLSMISCTKDSILTKFLVFFLPRFRINRAFFFSCRHSSGLWIEIHGWLCIKTMFTVDDVKWHYAYPCNSNHNYFINIIILLANSLFCSFFSLNCYNCINPSNLWNLKSWNNY
jgi:hypothetical protein